MRPGSRILLALASLSFLVAGAMPAVADYVPAGYLAYTQDLEDAGIPNGYMPSDRLLTVHGCTLERDAAYMFILMYEDAEEDGIRLRTEDCYRSYRTQAAAYERRCPWTDVRVKAVDTATGVESWGSRPVRVCSGPPTARPGQSNHSWGRAIDFRDRQSVLTCNDEEFLWLQANAHRYGWVHPPWAHCGSRLEEAWHWEWAGVVDANLVPDYSATWMFNQLGLARMMANPEAPIPLPLLGYGESEYVERWEDSDIDASRIYHLADL